MSEQRSLRAQVLMKDGLADLLRAPFVWLVGIGVLGILATAPIDNEDPSVLVGIAIVSLISAYCSIGLTLAAAEDAPDHSPEAWVRAAFVRRCLLRSFFTAIFATVLVVGGLFALIVPGLMVGAAVALADIAAVLENHGPGDALRRSLEVSKPARFPIGLVFALFVIVPAGALQVTTYFVEIDPAWLGTAAQCSVFVLSSAAHISLTKAFVTLGGQKLPRDVKPSPPTI